MKKLFFLFLPVLLASCIKDRVPEPTAPTDQVDLGERKLIHYWNFNSAALLTPSYTIGNGAISTENVYDAVTPGSTWNARNSDDTGSALRVRNPSTFMVVKAPTTGYRKPILTFAAMRTGNGPQENRIAYTVDGSNYITTGIKTTVITITEQWQMFSVDFSEVEAASDNADFAVKFTFSVGNENASGNDRYDNITIDAFPVTPGNNPDTSGNDTTAHVDTTLVLMHYWNFNAVSADSSVFRIPTYSFSQADISYAGAYMDTVLPGSAINARNSDIAGSALRLRNPAGSFTLTVPSNGYKNLKLSFAVMRTNNGAQQNIISYSTDGTTFVGTGLSATTNTVGTDYALVTYDFSAVAAADNNDKFKIRIDFGSGGVNSSGNNRIDNITLEGRKQ